MADVRPFRALRYNPSVVGELSDIVSPPFDTIPAELQRSLYRRSPYNVVRLEAGERLPSDTAKDNRYTRAAALMDRWVREGALARDEKPAYYLVNHSFDLQGREMERRELMAAVRVEEYDRRVVLPHEYTRDEDKRDRLALMEACHANFSPIMCLYRDEEHEVAQVLDRAAEGPPLASFSDPGRQRYTVWRIDGLEDTSQIRRALAPRPLYIADGHHRYETALTYRNSVAAGAHPEDNASGFVMMGLVDFSDPGLMVLPYHRVLGGLDDSAVAEVRAGLARFFVDSDFSGPAPRGLQEFQKEIGRLGRDTLAMGLLESGVAEYRLLRSRGDMDAKAWGLVGRSEAWILEELVLKPVLGGSLERCLAYVHEGEEVRQRVLRGESQMGFLMKPFPLDLFGAIMDQAQRLPPKSTFFYPKLPTGIVINPLTGRV